VSDERDRDLQDWFERSVEELPREPFTRKVMEEVRRRERRLRWWRYAAVLVVSFSFYLLLPVFVVVLNKLAALPSAMVAIAGEQWRLLVVGLAVVGYGVVKQAQRLGLLRYR